MIEGRQVIVKECPCFRQFEGETLCINNDIIKKMLIIDVDPAVLASKHVSEEFLKSRTSEDDLCFCLAYLGDDKQYYCMSQQHNITVRGQLVSEEEMQRALDLLAPDTAMFSGVLCGECLYNIIVALKEQEEVA